MAKFPVGVCSSLTSLSTRVTTTVLANDIAIPIDKASCQLEANQSIIRKVAKKEPAH